MGEWMGKGCTQVPAHMAPSSDSSHGKGRLAFNIRKFETGRVRVEPLEKVTIVAGAAIAEGNLEFSSFGIPAYQLQTWMEQSAR